ncbi:GIY-YIG nuclease family protein [Candidatus Gracilibacteria bacterium]|nr:GIY-YIG nuclease family protein [Candidatus Gracilibacteria bacterium]
MLTNWNNRVLYTGVTNNLLRRIQEHQEGKILGFTQKYNVKKLVYFEETDSIHVAIEREKEIKGWIRQKKNILIEEENPQWKDLSEELYE